MPSFRPMATSDDEQGRRQRLTRPLILLLATLALTAGCAAFDEQQRRWVFQPSKESWAGGAAALPSEALATEDAQAAWHWLASRHPGAPRYVYGHSLGSAIAVDLASAAGPADAPAGMILEGAFTSIPDVVATFRYGWLPLGP